MRKKRILKLWSTAPLILIIKLYFLVLNLIWSLDSFHLNKNCFDLVKLTNPSSYQNTISFIALNLPLLRESQKRWSDFFFIYSLLIGRSGSEKMLSSVWSEELEDVVSIANICLSGRMREYHSQKSVNMSQKGLSTNYSKIGTLIFVNDLPHNQSRKAYFKGGNCYQIKVRHFSIKSWKIKIFSLNQFKTRSYSLKFNSLRISQSDIHDHADSYSQFEKVLFWNGIVKIFRWSSEIFKECYLVWILPE